MMFKVGDSVVALTNPSDWLCQPRRKGEIYEVKAVIYCSMCGDQKINIGPSTWMRTGKCKCGHILATFGLYFTRSIYFEKVIDDSVLEAELQSISEPCTTMN